MIHVENVNKRYGQVDALINVNINVKENEIFGLIGPDGAGKTTLFRILATLIKADSGDVSMADLDVEKDYKTIRTIVGYMPGRFSLYHDLTVEENINFFASIFGMTMRDAYHLIEPIYKQIEPFKMRRAGKLSGGMKQKLALCCALIHKPKVLLLDEPTTGVDVVSRAEFWNMLGDLKKQGITIVVSTPYMDEASRCDRIALMNKGRTLTINTPAKLIENYDKRLYSITASNIYQLLLATRQHEAVMSVYSFGDSCHATVSNAFSEDEYLAAMHTKGFDDVTLKRIEPTIEDVFISL